MYTPKFRKKPDFPIVAKTMKIRNLVILRGIKHEVPRVMALIRSKLCAVWRIGSPFLSFHLHLIYGQTRRKHGPLAGFRICIDLNMDPDPGPNPDPDSDSRYGFRILIPIKIRILDPDLHPGFFLTK